MTASNDPVEGNTPDQNDGEIRRSVCRVCNLVLQWWLRGAELARRTNDRM